MNWLSRTFARLRKVAKTQPRPITRRHRPTLELLEDRAVPTVTSSITGNFNGTAIPAGASIWFSSVGKVSGLGSTTATLHVVNAEIDFTANNTAYSVPVPNSTLTFVPGATSATTTFDSNGWNTSVPKQLSGNVFLAGTELAVPSGLPGGIKNVTWSAQFWTDTPGISVNWQWAAAVYTNFGTDYGSLAVKPVDSSSLSDYKNSDHAGTPEVYKSFVVGGCTGGGGSNFTGSYSATKTVVPEGVTTATISGHVFNDANQNGVLDSGEGGLAGATVEILGTDNHGNPVDLTVSVDATTGLYQFTNLAPGAYSVLANTNTPDYQLETSVVGTVNGTPDGTAGTGSTSDITLAAGDNGINYDFGAIIVQQSVSIGGSVGGPSVPASYTITVTDTTTNTIVGTFNGSGATSYVFSGLTIGDSYVVAISNGTVTLQSLTYLNVTANIANADFSIGE